MLLLLAARENKVESAPALLRVTLMCNSPLAPPCSAFCILPPSPLTLLKKTSAAVSGHVSHNSVFSALLSVLAVFDASMGRAHTPAKLSHPKGLETSREIGPS